MRLDVLGVMQCYLYGHSNPATIALLFAAAFPDRALSPAVEAHHVYSRALYPSMRGP